MNPIAATAFIQAQPSSSSPGAFNDVENRVARLNTLPIELRTDPGLLAWSRKEQPGPELFSTTAKLCLSHGQGEILADVQRENHAFTGWVFTRDPGVVQTASENGIKCSFNLSFDRAADFELAHKSLKNAQSIEAVAVCADSACAGDKESKNAILTFFAELPPCVKNVMLESFGPIESDVVLRLPRSVERLTIEGAARSDGERQRFLQSHPKFVGLELRAQDSYVVRDWSKAIAAQGVELEYLTVSRTGSLPVGGGAIKRDALVQLLKVVGLMHLKLPPDFADALQQSAVEIAMEANTMLQSIDLSGGELPPRMQALLARNRMAMATRTDRLVHPQIEIRRVASIEDRRWPSLIEVPAVLRALDTMDVKGATDLGLRAFTQGACSTTPGSCRSSSTTGN